MRGVGENLEQFALPQLHDELQAVVDLAYILMERVVVAAIVFLDIRPQDISHRRIEECVDGAILGQLECFAQRAAFQFEDRFVAPLIAPEDEARQHLLGGIFPIMPLAIELLGEVDGEGLHRADTVVVEHVELAKFAGR